MPIDFSVKDHIATMVLNRPEAMNSLDKEMREQIYICWERMRNDEDIHVVVITGAGDKAFCTGSDLKNSPPPPESFAELYFGKNNPGTMTHGFGSDRPIICAVNGYAVGGGMELALACDICVAVKGAKFGLTEAKIGSVPGSGGVQRLPRTVGKSDAMLMLLTGEMVDADEAMRMGFVSKVVEKEDLMSTAYSIARKIADNAPLAVRAIKRSVIQGLDMPLPLALEMDKQVYGLLRNSEDRLEGRQAFKEKRKPVYRGK
jgi:E-phenylitaconyl-CoA hydratase